MTNYTHSGERSLTLLAALVLLFGFTMSLFVPAFSHAQSTSGTGDSTGVTAPADPSGGTGTVLPSTSVEITTGAPADTTNADSFGGLSANTWVILVVVVIAVALIIVGWGMGTGGATREDIRREVHVR
ncbi:MAG: hypothetical protein V4674_02605 [Patescibacteria group bacterium]